MLDMFLAKKYTYGLTTYRSMICICVMMIENCCDGLSIILLLLFKDLTIL